MRTQAVLTTIAACFLAIGVSAQSSQTNATEDDVAPGQQWLAEHRKQNTREYRQVAASVGTLLLVEDDADGLGLEMLFDEEYKKIRKLPLSYRKKFFWTLMFRLRLRTYAHFAEEFFETLATDCGDEMTKALDIHISEAKKAGATEAGLEHELWLQRSLKLSAKQGKH